MAYSFKKLHPGPGVVAYLADQQGAGDYYSEAGRAFMRWQATPRARALFGLGAPGQGVDRFKLELLLSGRDPITGELIRKAGADGTMVVGLDLTLSPAPKSLSVLWAFGDAALKREIEHWVGQAVNLAAEDLMEEALVRERDEEGQVQHVRAEDYIAVQVLHTTARLAADGGGVPDPQLHVHVVLIGGVGANGRIKAFDSRAVLQRAAEIEAKASNHLAGMVWRGGFELERRVERKKDGAFKDTRWEVGGIPKAAVTAFSNRTSELDELKVVFEKKYGRPAEGEAWNRWVAGQRGPKAKLTAEELYEAWVARGEPVGMTPELQEQLLAARHERQQPQLWEIYDSFENKDEWRRQEGERRDRVMQTAEAAEFRKAVLAEVCREHALVPLAQLDRLAQKLARAVITAHGPLDSRDAGIILARMMRDGDLMPTTDGRVTTLEVLAAEQRAMKAAQGLLDADLVQPMSDAARQALAARREREGRPFDQDQVHAIAAATNGSRLVSITGLAGSGKGYASAGMTELWHAQGRRVIAVAVSGNRAQEAAADAEARLALTIDQLRWRVEHGRLALSLSDVLLVDEGGQIDHHRYADLLEVANQSGATVVQLGDARQLSPIGPGGLWTQTHELARRRGRAAELTVVRRARDPEEAAAWSDIRHGSVRAGLEWYRKHGRIHLYQTRRELLAGQVERWWQATLAHRAGGERSTARPPVMLVDTSNAERDVLNRMAQERRVEAGELGQEALKLSSGQEIRAGDRIVFRQVYRIGEGRSTARVENGTEAQVISVDAERRQAEVQLKRGDQYRVTVGLDVALELGYARHAAMAQGITADAADVAVSHRTSRNELYVMVSRSRQGSHIHALSEHVEELQEEPAEARDGPRLGTGPADFAFRERQPKESVLEYEAARDAAYEWSQRAEAGLEVEQAAKQGGQRESERQRVFREWLEARQQRQRELVTVGRIGERSWDATKQAIGQNQTWDREVTSDVREAHEQSRWAGRDAIVQSDYGGDTAGEQERRWQIESGREPDREPEQRPSRDFAREAQERSQRRAANLQEREQAAARRREAERNRQALPAHNQVETMARWHLEGRETARALAYYRTAGLLELTDDPAARAVERLRADRGAAIVVADRQDEQAVHAAIERSERPEDRDQEHRRVLRAEEAYRTRRERREPWEAQQKPQDRHRVEPDTVPRAYVVAADHQARAALTRAVSVAAESHLITKAPRIGLAAQIEAHAAEIKRVLENRSRDEREQARQRAAEQTAERVRDRSVERSQERQAAEREATRSTERG